jgi:hypothetical protein
VFSLFRRAEPVSFTPNLELPVFDHNAPLFSGLRERRVLIYWPHGFGDFVHLSYIVPMLEPSNAYFLTRFGDDFVHLYDEGGTVTPMFSGRSTIGSAMSPGDPPHLGLHEDRIPNGPAGMYVPEPLRSRMIEARIDTVLYTKYPEMTGRTPFPWHTKARYVIGKLAPPERLQQADLTKPLRSSLTFLAPPEARAPLEERLRSFVGTGDRLYLIAPGGHTQLEKIWPESEVQRFAREVRRRDARARVLAIDERRSEQIGRERGLAPTVADLFSDLGVPFAHLVTTLVRASRAFAGVGSGPLHCALAIGGRPIAGIWLAHWPEYYDEPSDGSVHLVGPRVYREKLDRRVGAVTKQREAPGLFYDIVPFRKRAPSAEDVLDALFARLA